MRGSPSQDLKGQGGKGEKEQKSGDPSESPKCWRLKDGLAQAAGEGSEQAVAQ